MKRLLTSLLLILVCGHVLAKPDPRTQPGNLYPKIKLETTIGDMVVELNRARAPLTVQHFLDLVVNKEYDGTIFSRVIPGFVAQAGGYNKRFQAMGEAKPVFNESGNGLLNRHGTLAMARMTGPHSAKRQFYFNLNDNKHLDPNKRGWGYAVFGEVIEGSDLLDQLEETETEFNATLNQPDVPKQTILIKRIIVLPRK